jgi:hypothetical protein
MSKTYFNRFDSYKASIKHLREHLDIYWNGWGRKRFQNAIFSFIIGLDLSVRPCMYAPGSSPCLGATRDIAQYSIGWVYKLYNGPAGRLQYGIAYSYLNRVGWVGIGGAPKAVNNLIYTSARYYIP